jgi:hypothetical protein
MANMASLKAINAHPQATKGKEIGNWRLVRSRFLRRLNNWSACVFIPFSREETSNDTFKMVEALSGILWSEGELAAFD